MSIEYHPHSNKDEDEKEKELQHRAKPSITSKTTHKYNIINTNDAVVAPPPVGSLPRRQPLPATFGSPPKPIFNSPNFSEELRERLRMPPPAPYMSPPKEATLLSSSLHTNSYNVGSSVDSSPPPVPIISFDEKKTKLSTIDRSNKINNNNRSAARQQSSSSSSRQQQQQQEEEEQSQQKAIISSTTTRRSSTSSSSNTASSLVVCGVDGTVYTLDAYTGKLRNMFSSGPALVVTSSPYDDDDDSVEATAGDDESTDHQATTDDEEEDLTSYAVASKVIHGNRKERVIPGLLDGRLYSVFQYEMEDDLTGDDDDDVNDNDTCSSYDYVTETCERGDDGTTLSSSTNNPSTRIGYTLTPHHIRVMDVVDSPFSTCTYNDHHSNNHENKQHCGIILGSKKVTIYAIEPMTGKVKWQQDPQGGAGKRGYTTHPPPRQKNGNAGAIDGRTVLLQREDYVVKHTDAEDGSEVWKIELGMFMPLDFGSGLDNDDNRSNKKQPQQSNDDDIFTNSGRTSGSVVGGSGRKRGIAAIAASVEDKKKSSSIGGGIPSILGSKRDSLRAGGGNHKDPLFDDNEDDDMDHDHSSRGLPSIAFGKDRKSLMAVDAISREVIWSVKIESEVAIVLGVDRESKWTELDVIEETAIFTNGQSSSSTRNDAHTHRPSSSPVYGNLTPYGEAVEEENDHFGRHGSHMFVRTKFEVVDEIDDGYNLLPQGITPNNEIGHDFHPPKFSIYPTEFYPSEMMMPGGMPPLSHRTEHGLYLTWSMVVSVILTSLSVIVFFARVIILRQKRKWEKKAASQDVTSPPSSSEDESISQSALPVRKIPPAPTSGGNFYTDILTKKKTLFRRSMSAGVMESQYSLGSKKAESDIDGAASNLLKKSLNSPRLSALPSTLGTKTLTTEASSDLKDSRPRLDSIDGIPLVRYSRYTSEFKEILPLGRGGFGTVFQCRNVLDGHEYAIKKIKIATPLSAEGNVTKQLSHRLHRVLREVKCLALLDHPNIVRYYTAWLEVDQHDDDDETHTTNSIFDLKGSGRIFSGGLFSGFASNSMAMRLPFSKRTSHGSGFLGLYNHFGSLPLDESKSIPTHQHDDYINDSCKGGDDDLGFTWERSKENTADQSVITKKQLDECQSSVGGFTGECQSSVGGFTGDNGLGANAVDKKRDIKHVVKFPESTINEDKHTKSPEGRHILFIQMQLCSVKTLADFLSSREARCGTIPQCSLQKSQYAVDVPFALRLFAQIAQGIKHVHKQGLIHRDLKPQNCFIDDAEGVVKVGDFGLSRESSTSADMTNNNESYEDVVAVDLPCSCEAENTVGVGTRAYASPEQMRGSDYDASTDVFSLGLILFELLYPMYTAMERYKEFANIRKGIFPAYWNSHVRSSFTTVHDLLIQMISDSASARPTADAVSERIDSLLREYSIQSLDKSWGTKGALLLRVEAKEKDGILATTMQLIRDAAPLAKVLQYGLRGQNSKAVMEFALEVKDDEKLRFNEIAARMKLQHEFVENDMSIRQVTNS